MKKASDITELIPSIQVIRWVHDFDFLPVTCNHVVSLDYSSERLNVLLPEQFQEFIELQRDQQA